MNLNALPTSRFQKTEFKVADPGVYWGKVTKTEMRVAKSGADYLSVTIDITDKDGNKKGKVFDMFMDSDKAFILYKLRRFLTACDVPCTGEMSLKDIGVLVQDANLVVWVQQDEFNGKTRLVPNLRDAEGYYPGDSFFETYNIWAAVEGKEPLDPTAGLAEDDNEEIPFATSEDDF